jgi:hypothetical protein
MRVAITIVGVAVLAILGPAVAQPQTSPALSAVLNLCAREHADPTRVLRAADGAGWQPIAPSGKGGLLDLLNMAPKPNVRLKTEGPDRLMLTVEEMHRDTSSGDLIKRKCDVIDEGPGSIDVVGELERLLGAVPGDRATGAAMWIYLEDPQGKHFLPSAAEAQNRELERGQTVVSLGAVNSPKAGVFYTEAMLTRR